MPRQVRFTQLVKAAGRPHPATLWVADPSKDPEFKKAIDQNRIVTIHHVNVGTKKESGEIGFKKTAGASFLIFPKSLPQAEGTRIIGLKFDMLEDPKVKNPVKIKPAKRKTKIERANIVQFPHAEPEPDPEPKSKQPKPQRPQEEKTPSFTVTVEFTAKATKQIKVEAKNATEAIEAALKQAKRSSPEPDWNADASTVTRHD